MKTKLLNYTDHIEYVCNKLQKFIGVFTGLGTNFHKSALEPCILLLFTPTY